MNAKNIFAVYIKKPNGYFVTNLQPYGNVIIETGSDVTFKATRNIELSAGFEVKSGALFYTEIYESSCF